MTFDEIMKLKKLSMNLRDCPTIPADVLKGLNALDAEITRIANRQCAQSAEQRRLLNAIDAAVMKIRSLPMGKHQAD